MGKIFTWYRRLGRTGHSKMFVAPPDFAREMEASGSEWFKITAEAAEKPDNPKVVFTYEK